jgi:transcriptional regulator with GAF, ATPase, and Fis domain
MTKQFEFKKNEKNLKEQVDFLHEVTVALLDEVKSLVHLKTVEIKNGIDYDEEIKNFEIHLIERALERTGGNQLQAARLLNLKPTTLHEKIKRFSIR